MVLTGTRGSHYRLKYPDGRATTVPVRAGRDVPKGTLLSVLRDAVAPEAQSVWRLDLVDKPPHIAAGIRVCWRTVARMLPVERLRAVASLVVTRDELVKRRWGELLSDAEVPLRATLGGTGVEFGSLVCEMKQEPQLDARVRKRDHDAPRGSELHRVGQFRMLVPIEDTPVLVKRIAPATRCFPPVEFLLVSSFLHELQRRSVEVVNRHNDPSPVQAIPVHEVERLCLLPFSEDKKLKAFCGA